jgi:hypothetical protein
MAATGPRFAAGKSLVLTIGHVCILTPVVGQLTAHVRTRAVDTVRSKAQKYFIKLFRDGQPLPAKVGLRTEGYLAPRCRVSVPL